jgi:hypothetical protein
VYVAAFSDEALHSEVAAKAAFWLQDNFYGVDVRCLHKHASDAYFAQVRRRGACAAPAGTRRGACAGAWPVRARGLCGRVPDQSRQRRPAGAGVPLLLPGSSVGRSGLGAHCAAPHAGTPATQHPAPSAQRPAPSAHQRTPTHANTPPTPPHLPRQVVVDAFDPHLLVSNAALRTFDFATATEAELLDIAIPLELAVAMPCAVHGLATWFDVLFNGSSVQTCLSTAPGAPTTHWCAAGAPPPRPAPWRPLPSALRVTPRAARRRPPASPHRPPASPHRPPTSPPPPPAPAAGSSCAACCSSPSW